MWIQLGAAAMVTAGFCASAEPLPAPGAERSVTVCMQVGPDGLIRGTVQPQVSRIFADIGVRIEWARDVRVCMANEGIVVSLSYDSPRTKDPRAWGYALPYERTHLVVFYDRVQRTIRRTGTQNLLAYVLAHELAHMLQAINRHSASGIMKARWDSSDYFEMERGTLRFSAADVYLIYMGLDARAAHRNISASGAGN